MTCGGARFQSAETLSERCDFPILSASKARNLRITSSRVKEARAALVHAMRLSPRLAPLSRVSSRPEPRACVGCSQCSGRGYSPNGRNDNNSLPGSTTKHRLLRSRLTGRHPPARRERRESSDLDGEPSGERLRARLQYAVAGLTSRAGSATRIAAHPSGPAPSPRPRFPPRGEPGALTA